MVRKSGVIRQSRAKATATIKATIKATAMVNAVQPGAGTTVLKSAELNLDTPVTAAKSLLLRANVPTVVTLTGSPDMLFSAFTVTLTARELVRDMALPEWGTAKSKVDDGTEYLLPGLTRVERVSVDAASGTEAELLVKRNGEFDTAEPVKVKLVTTGARKAGSRIIAFETDAVRLTQPSSGATPSLWASSLPARVGIAIGDDSPLQVFATGMAEGGTAASRDLAAQVHAAWRRATATAGVTKVSMKLTSQTDGVVDLALGGSWGRYFAGPETSLALNPVDPVTIALPWPFGPGPLGAAATLRLTGNLTGGRRLKLVPAVANFTVRVQEQLEVAQAVLIAAGGTTAAARQVTAIWLHLPAVPRTEEKVELRLAAAEGDPAAPADSPLLRAEIALPADAALYISAGGGWWYRAALAKPVALDGAHVSQPLFVVAAGRGAGTPLSHGHSGPLPAGGVGAARVPAAPGQVGVALVRNLGRTGAWEPQPFSRQAAAWVMDLELAPLPAEYGALVTATLAGQPPVPVGFTGPGAATVALQWPSVPPAATVPVTLQSVVTAACKAQVSFYRRVL